MSEAQLVQCHQVDERGIYLYTRERRGYGSRHVAVEPPSVPAGQLARWKSPHDPYADLAWRNDGQWFVTEDHRGSDLYTSDGKYELGADYQGASYEGVGPVPGWLATSARPSTAHNLIDGLWVLDEAAALAAAKSEKLLQIDASRDQAIAAGFEHAGSRYDSDSKSIQRISAIATLALMDPEYSTPYITADNSIVTLDAEAIGALSIAAAQHESSLVFGARQLKDLVLAAQTVEEVAAVVWVGVDLAGGE